MTTATVSNTASQRASCHQRYFHVVTASEADPHLTMCLIAKTIPFSSLARLGIRAPDLSAGGLFVVAGVVVVIGIADDINGANFHNYPPSGNLQDEDGHGTHVAGIIGGRGLAGQGMQGIARVRLMTCKALGLRGIGNLSNAVKCIDYALIKGADIIVASWVSPAVVLCISPSYCIPNTLAFAENTIYP
jgi:subtilisin family serine protease